MFVNLITNYKPKGQSLIQNKIYETTKFFHIFQQVKRFLSIGNNGGATNLLVPGTSAGNQILPKTTIFLILFLFAMFTR